MVFLSCQTQWNKVFAGMDGTLIWHGLNYQAVESVMRMMGHWKKAGELFEGLRLMEATALPLLNKRASK